MNINYKMVILLFLLGLLWGCQEELDNYLYADTEEYVDVDLMTLLKENENYSEYVALLEKYNVDTIFANGKSLTLFVPNNEAMENMGQLYLDTIDVIKGLFAESYINVKSIQGARQIKMLGGKFLTIEARGNKSYLNGVELIYAGPLNKNGKYYEIGTLVQPLPNLYEYIAATNPFFRSYIDRQDSIYLNLNLSTPIGYNEAGQTIYDSVLTVVNLFEANYFEVKSESRTRRATMLLFDEFQFDNALSMIADDLGLDSKDAIPDQWINDILFPYLVNQGVFWNELDFEDFASGKLRNIRGDSVTVSASNIDPESEFFSSNGKVFNYLNFSIPDSVYKPENRIQGEHLVVSRGFGQYAWSDNVQASGAAVTPVVLRALNVADNDSILVVDFPEANYAKPFSLSFSFKNVFPGTYRFIWRGRTTPSGVFEIAINGVVQKINLGRGDFDYVDLYDLRNNIRSFTGEVFRPASGYNRFDILVENITEYGDVEVTIRYLNPGQRTNNGFSLDYVELQNFSQ